MITARMLGRLALVGESGSLQADELGGARPRRLLEVLLLSPGRVVHRGRLADLLWEGTPPVGHESTLASHVCTLRHELSAIGAGGVTLVDTVADGYLMPRGAVHRDLDDLERLAAQVAQGTADPEETARLVAAVRGELLEDETGVAWLRGPREAARRQLLDLVLHVCDLAIGEGDWRTALRRAEQAARMDPYSERACLTHARVLLSRGDRALAATVLDRHHRLLHETRPLPAATAVPGPRRPLAVSAG